MDDIECFICHNYGHIAHHCKYNMESTMNKNIDDKNNKFWKIKQVQDEQVQDEQEKKEGKKVSVVILSGFIIGRTKSVVSLVI